MGKRQKQVSRPSSPPKQVSRPSSPPRENSEELPLDLLIDIFSRLPLEDVARCRCVSKLWSCVLRCREFTRLFLKLSSARPRILITFLHNGRRNFYSIPQDLDPDRNYSSPISAYHLMDFPKGSGSSEDICAPILGLVCSNSKKPMICNPSTGEYISLPKATTKRNKMTSYFGYDPIDNLFKVLCVSSDYVCRVSNVGMEEVTWRTVECSIPHKPLHREICIDGYLCYLAQGIGNGCPTPFVVVCFDIRRERFNILAAEFVSSEFCLINYKGALGVLWADSYRMTGYIKTIELHLLEDVNSLSGVKWSKKIYTLPCYWKDLAADNYLKIVGMTGAGEIVMSTCCLKGPLNMFYYNTVKNTVVRVEVDFGALKANRSSIVTLMNHVENVEIM